MKEINIETWNRRDVYKNFADFTDPFYAITVPVDVTPVKEYSKRNQISFYHTMIWAVTKAVNQVPQFNIRIRDGRLYQLDHVDPNFTILKSGAEVFQYMFLPWKENPVEFSSEVFKEMDRQGDRTFGDFEDTDETVYLTCTPWFDFTALTNPHSSNTDDTIPRIGWGRYYKEGDRLMLHMSIEANHKTIDGYHIGLLKAAIDRVIASMEEM
ncbi:MAG: CatA-like O-acetyltransferase [Eubacteriales bacterium]|nr:CatA-like O-acetyltransferase [Eubacteriales bacterium]